MELPFKAVDLSTDEQARLRKLNDAQQGMQNFMQSMLTAGETRAAALQQQGRELFEELAKKYGLDLTKVTYVPSPDGTQLVPTLARL